MAKKKINYSDLSNKELELLKDIYIDQKVKSMNINDLKGFAFENISLQIKNTIGNDEELEAWQEMEDFFKDEFLNTIKDIYVDLRVKSMNDNDLKDFALENISLQIKNTIGNDEELDAWQEMEDFFKDEFHNTIHDIQIKMKSKNGEITYSNIEEKKSVSQDIDEEKKLDMWED